jgi:hypothetical protein
MQTIKESMSMLALDWTQQALAKPTPMDLV